MVWQWIKTCQNYTVNLRLFGGSLFGDDELNSFCCTISVFFVDDSFPLAQYRRCVLVSQSPKADERLVVRLPRAKLRVLSFGVPYFGASTI